MYNFMTSHQNPVRNTGQRDGGSGQLKQQGVVFSFASPDTDLGWYYPDPPAGDGHLTYSDTTHYPRKGIVLHAQLVDGTAYNRKSKSPGEWIVPDDFGTPKGMGTPGMMPAGSGYGTNNGGIYGSMTLSQVYPNWQESVFVKMAKFIQDAEDAIYAHEYGVNGVGGYHDYIDIDSFIDYQIAFEVCNNYEFFALNGHYMHFDPSIGKLKMGILWDFDLGWNSSTNYRDSYPGYVGKTPFWYKELLGWEVQTTTPNGTNGTDGPNRGVKRPDRVDPYYVSRLQARWAEVKGRLRTELDPYIDAQDARLSRVVPPNYSHPWVIDGSRQEFKTKISDIITRLDTVFAGYGP
jgi:hypothetical protein